MQTEPINLVLADDHEMLRDGFKLMCKKIPGIRLLACVENGQELLKAVQEHHPQIVITDMKMPVMDGLEATKKIKEQFPGIKVIALSSFDEQPLIMAALSAGADGYVLKNISKEEFQKAIDTVLSGKPYYCAEAAEKLLNHINENLSKTINTIYFTEREKEVLQLIAALKTSKEISDLLFISIRTVERHRHSIYRKTGTNSVAGLAMWVERNLGKAGR
jgi:DNA-binding NarL/FixJ family response regulator